MLEHITNWVLGWFISLVFYGAGLFANRLSEMITSITIKNY